jgi:hypothetical protein
MFVNGSINTVLPADFMQTTAPATLTYKGLYRNGQSVSMNLVESGTRGNPVFTGVIGGQSVVFKCTNVSSDSISGSYTTHAPVDIGIFNLAKGDPEEGSCLLL